jgi:hypothetical protein
MSDPTIRPDGAWRWDGAQWVPNRPAAAPPAAPPQKKSGAGKKLSIGCFSAVGAIALLLIVVVAVSATRGGSGSTTASGATASSTAAPKPSAPACQQPCAVDDGVTLAVSNVQYGASGGDFDQPQAGTAYVTMQITVKNDGNSEYHLNPFNFVLKDATGVKHTYRPIFSNQATTWEAVNLTRGATQSETLSFQAAAGQPTGLTLVWSPHGFGGDKEIKLS